jgi:hypothetical protein
VKTKPRPCTCDANVDSVATYKRHGPQHTQGPWHRNIKPARKYVTIFAGRNTHVCHLATSGLTDEEIEANADLIAAAPELLTACERLAAWDASHDDSQLISEACSFARAAIAKARGGAL